MSYPTHGDQTVFLVLSGPSGAGKSTLIASFLKRHPEFVRCISVTTRQPRPGERHGIDYFFTAPDEFNRMVLDGAFLEHAQVFGQHSYGTPRSFVAENFADGRSVVKDVDVQGAIQIRRSFPTAVQVFIVPPSREEIERRLRLRATEGEDAIRRRLSEAQLELMQWAEYDYLVYNGDLDLAVSDLSAVVRAEQLKAPGRGVHRV
ncbi:MAG: guanylate kinase [Planctomycetes bacterium]|nr:guanylate kinase [Planctomycetota bacterium]